MRNLGGLFIGLLMRKFFIKNLEWASRQRSPFLAYVLLILYVFFLCFEKMTECVCRLGFIFGPGIGVVSVIYFFIKYIYIG